MNFNKIEELVIKEKMFFLVLYRFNSSRVYEKNLRPFHYSNLLDIKLKHLLDSGIQKENIILCGDYSCSDLNGFSILNRDIDYVIDNNITFSDTLVHIYNKIKESKLDINHLFFTYPTSPMFNDIMYKKAIYSYYKNVIKGGYDSIISGVNKKGFFWKDGKTVNYSSDENHQYTQDIKPVFECNNAFWGGKFDILKKRKYFVGENPFLMDVPGLFSIDIDTMEDFKMAESIYDSYMNGFFDDIY